MIYTHLMSIFRMTEVAFTVFLHMTQFQFCSFFFLWVSIEFWKLRSSISLVFPTQNMPKSCEKKITFQFLFQYWEQLHNISSFDFILQGLNFCSSRLSIDKEEGFTFHVIDYLMSHGPIIVYLYLKIPDNAYMVVCVLFSSMCLQVI